MSQLARRYAAACFDLGVDRARFARSVRLIEDTPPLRRVLEDPTVDRTEKERVLGRLDVLKEEPQLLNFYRLLARKNRMALLPEIAEAFHTLELEARNTAMCRMRCVHIPDEAQLDGLRKRLCVLHHRDAVELEIETDPGLLGGFVLEIDGFTYDYSVRGQLRDMERQLQERRMI